MNRPSAILLLLAGILLAMPLHAQTDPEYRMEIGVGGGLTNYMGDFNGNVGTGHKPGASLLYRYILNPRQALRFSIGYGKFEATSMDSNTAYPDYGTGLWWQQNEYKFSNTLTDLNVAYEYNFWPYGTGRDYRGAKRFTPFVMIGAGLTYVDNSADGVLTVNVPVGLGVKYKIGDRLNLNLGWQFHFTMSDMLDGVEDPYGVTSSGVFKNNDCYSTLMIGLTYSFKEKCRVCHNDD